MKEVRTFIWCQVIRSLVVELQLGIAIFGHSKPRIKFGDIDLAR